MKAIGNWKAWESKDGSVKRIYISDSAYLDEGDTGLVCGHNVTEAEANFIFNTYGKMPFAEFYENVKNASKTAKTSAKEKKAKNKLFREICGKYSTFEERDKALKEAGF